MNAKFPSSGGCWSRLLPTALPAFLAMVLLPVLALAAPGDDVPAIQLSLAGGMTEPDKVSLALEILFLLTVLSLAPAIMMTVTSFTRIIIVFHFVRQAMGIQQLPPTQILASLAIFMTLIIMYPVGREINDTALQPYLAEQIDFNEALDRAQVPLRSFMFKHTREKDISSSTPLPKWISLAARTKCLPPCWPRPMCSASLKPGSASVFSFIFPFLLLTWWCPASCLPWV